MGARSARYKNTISRRNQGGGPSKSGLVLELVMVLVLQIVILDVEV